MFTTISYRILNVDDDTEVTDLPAAPGGYPGVPSVPPTYASDGNGGLVITEYVQIPTE